jgi:hypothetical protein
MRKNIFIIVFFLLFSFVFLYRLFIPKLSIIATEEIGVNDVWQQYYAFKQIYSDSLHQGFIPVWTDKVAGGFPLLAEGQEGIFYIVNLILFGLFPTPLAFNLGFIVSFFLCSIGTYLLLRKFGFSLITSISFSIAYAYSGFFVTHMSHYNLLEATSLLPWVLFSATTIFSNNRFGIIFFAYIFSQQIFTGHMQMSLVTLLALFILTIIYFYNHLISLQQIFKLAFAGTIGVLLASAQIIPTFELTSLSIRSKGVSFSEIITFKYPINHLLTLVSPFVLGNPQLGTYPHFRDNGGALFWETSGYMGILPILFAITGIILPIKKLYKQIAIVIVIFSFILMIGVQSPFYIILTIPPFSYFRFPSRFIADFCLGIIILASNTLEVVSQKISRSLFRQIFKICILIIIIIDIYSVWGNYHQVVPYSTFLELPNTAKILSQSQDSKFISLSSQLYLYKEFLDRKPGRVDRMIKLRNYLPANLYSVYNLNSFEVYTSQQPKRFLYFRSLVGDMDSGEGTDSADLLVSTYNLLGIKGINRIISPYKLNTENNNVKLISVSELPFNYDNVIPKIYLYELSNPQPKIKIFGSTKVISTTEDFQSEIQSKTFDYQKTALIENDHDIGENKIPLLSEITNQAFTNSGLKATVKVNQKSIFVTTINYYPGWMARIDGHPAEVIPVSILNMGVVVPSGQHSIELFFNPPIYRWGYLISIVSFLFMSIYFLIAIRRKN